MKKPPFPAKMQQNGAETAVFATMEQTFSQSLVFEMILRKGNFLPPKF